MMQTLPLKFNGGAGALLCTCDLIIAYGHEHQGKEYPCPRCQVTWRITGDNDRGRFEAVRITDEEKR